MKKLRWFVRYLVLFHKVLLFSDLRKTSVIDVENNRWWDKEDQ